MRTTSGNSMPPPVRQRYRPTCVISWSRHGYENASYCISATGRQPAMHRPTAVPRIPASASGVSTQRSAPKRSRSPAVARNTPPARPTSSPMTMTESSRASSTWKQSLIASTISSSANGPSEDAPQLRKILRERRGRVRVRVVEHERDVGLRLGLRLGDAGTHRFERLRADLGVEIVVEDATHPEVALVAADALVLLLLLDAFEIDVDTRIVRGRMRRRAIRHRLDERRPAAAARALHRLARRLVYREHVAA